MMSAVYLALLIGSGLSILVIAAARPSWIGEENQFLANFVNHEFLNLLGVILAITLASLSQIHLKLNEIEEKINKKVMAGSRAEVKSSAIWLIGLFVAAVIVVLVKPLIRECGIGAEFSNGVALWILLFNVLILSDGTLSIFGVGPVIHPPENGGRPSE